MTNYSGKTSDSFETVWGRRNDIEDQQRKNLEAAVIEAALNLFQFTGSGGFCLNIPGTNPPVYVVAGSADGLPRLVP